MPEGEHRAFIAHIGPRNYRVLEPLAGEESLARHAMPAEVAALEECEEDAGPDPFGFDAEGETSDAAAEAWEVRWERCLERRRLGDVGGSAGDAVEGAYMAFEHENAAADDE